MELRSSRRKSSIGPEHRVLYSTLCQAPPAPISIQPSNIMFPVSSELMAGSLM
jgi:hypothetical protein